MLLRSKFLYHTPCPKCNSRDNRAVYADGSSWCFGCGKWTPPTHKPQEQEEEHLPPPKDLTYNLPPAYNTWLKQYNLSGWQRQLFQWSPSRQRLISIITDKFWQERSLYKTPKILTHGNKPYHIFNAYPKQNTCVLVEDYISALKVAEVSDSFCLFGTTLNKEHELKLAKEYSNIIVWLDYDKYKEAIKIQNLIKPLTNCWVCCTPKDPKYYNHKEIQTYINKHECQ